MEYTTLIIIFALFQYSIFTMKVGANRAKFEVTAPSTEGNEFWERLFRVQQNTLEQLIIFLPAIIIFSQHFSQNWVLLPGIVFIVGRQIYSIAYIKKPESRGLGMVLSFFSSIGMLIASLISIGINHFG